MVDLMGHLMVDLPNLQRSIGAIAQLQRTGAGDASWSGGAIIAPTAQVEYGNLNLRRVGTDRHPATKPPPGLSRPGE
jgi:hypothetical protein